MTKHTPTPWKLAGIPDNMIVCDAEGGSIADCAEPGPWVSKKIAEANAAFIVKAVNNHDALVTALEAVRCEMVLAIAFLARDAGTDRAAETAKSLIERLAKADMAARALRSMMR